jgi:hypothetical protein
MNLTSLQSVADLIDMAGGKPNARYRAAMRALKALDAINNQPYVPPIGTDYKVALTNGKEVTLFVTKGSNVFKVANSKGYQVQSVSKI